MLLLQVSEQEFNVNFWIKSLNSLILIEIETLRQVLVALGFGSDHHHMLNRNIFNKVLNGTPRYFRSFNTCMWVCILFRLQLPVFVYFYDLICLCH